MLKEIIKVVDTNGDGKVQYEEFRVFVEAAERQLLMLFKAIDRDHNGKLDKDELQAAFQRAGIAIPVRRLNNFFQDIDHNKDGFITYEEWRDETLEGLGSPTNPPSSTLEENQEREAPTKQASPLSNAAARMDAVVTRPYVNSTEDDIISKADTSAVSQGIEPPILPTTQGAKAEPGLLEQGQKFVLISYLPDPGYFVAGAVAGGISRTATAPLDRLKVYLLVNTSTDASLVVKAAKKGQPLLAIRNAGRPLITAVTDLYKAGGFRGFFAGNGLNVVKIMPETAIRFGAYEAAKRTLADLEGHGDTHHINPYSKFVAGGFAGMVSQFCVYPLDTLKFRLQSEYVSGGARGNALLIQTFRKMYAEGGARAAYRGVTMGLVGMFPYSAIDMGTFEFLKTTYVAYLAKKYGVHEEDAQPNTFATGIMGATSGAFGASVVYPLNVLRTRLQTQGTSMHPARYTGILDVANKTVRNEGVRGLYKGLMPNLLKVAPALSITWMVYENAKHIMNLH
ncbi:hypothetical protein DL765_006038 [Monosporascus sp. GIB2]|nr:hypothetical protein DL765_006038 [Monosporascus sp. GIB2]